jgi:hypothetical protein
MALAQELGMRPLLAHCHFGLGKVLQRAGRQQEAREHLNAAAALYRDRLTSGARHALPALRAELPRDDGSNRSTAAAQQLEEF